MTSIEVVADRDVPTEGMVDLGSAAFGEDAGRYREYLLWKHVQNPYSRETRAYVALDARDRTVGMRTFYGTRWSVDGEEIDIPAADDFAIAPEHRHSGLAAALMRTALDDLRKQGFEYVVSTSAGRITALQSLAAGWKNVGPTEPVELEPMQHRLLHATISHLPNRVRRLSRAVRERGSNQERSRFESLDAAGPQWSRAGGSVVVTSLPPASELADLMSRLPVNRRIRHVRDSAFYMWRYANPSREYRFILYEAQGRLEGYLALAHCRSLGSDTPLLIVDWVGATEEIRTELLEFVVSSASAYGIRVWSASLPPESQARLAHAGFGPAQTELRKRGLPCVLLRKLEPSGEWLMGGVPVLDPMSWHVCLIDSMHG